MNDIPIITSSEIAQIFEQIDYGIKAAQKMQDDPTYFGFPAAYVEGMEFALQEMRMHVEAAIGMREKDGLDWEDVLA